MGAVVIIAAAESGLIAEGTDFMAVGLLTLGSSPLSECLESDCRHLGAVLEWTW